MRAPDIAAVIVSYRCAALTSAALQSLATERSKAVPRLRAYVVDNASGDLPELQRVVQQRGWGSWVTLIAAPRNGGFAYGNNLGIGHALRDGTPHYFYLLNPDAEVRPGAISSLVHFLEAHETPGIAGSTFENADGSAWPIAFRFPSLWSELDEGLGMGLITRVLQRWVVARRMSNVAQQVDWICGASMMIRPAVLTAIGGFDENYFLYYEETDFCRRALHAGFPTWYVPDSRVMHIAGQSTGVTERNGTPKRLPSYYLESRRRYFTVAYGSAKAMLIDIVALLAHCLGAVKLRCLRRGPERIPHIIRDLWRHSIVLTPGRPVPPLKCGAIWAGISNDYCIPPSSTDVPTVHATAAAAAASSHRTTA